MDIFDLDLQIEAELQSYALIEFIGGNPFYLLDSLRRSDAKAALKECAQERVLIGWSAAAFVFGPTLELVNRYSPEMNVMALKNLTGLNLTSIQVLPHYSKFLQRYDSFEETCSAYES